MVKEFSIHKHIFWLATFAPGGAQPVVDQTSLVLEKAVAWLNHLLAKSGLTQITPPDALDADALIATEQVPGVELDGRFAHIPSSNGLQLLFELQRKGDVIWLYAQLAATKPQDAEEGQRLNDFFPPVENDDDILGVFTTLGVWAEEPQQCRELAAHWLGRPTTDRLIREVHLAGDGQGNVILMRSSAPEEAIVCIHDTKEDETLRRLLFWLLPNMARYFVKRNYLFEREYKAKCVPRIHELQQLSHTRIQYAEAMIEEGLSEAELEQAEGLIGELVSFQNKFTNALADVEIVRQTLKTNLHNTEISLVNAPDGLQAFFEPSMEYFRRAGEQIQFDNERFRASRDMISSVLRGMEICDSLLRTRINDHENKRANTRNIIIAIVGIIIAFAEISTPDVVVSFSELIGITIDKDNHITIFAMQLIPFVLIAIIVLILFIALRNIRKVLYFFLSVLKYMFSRLWKPLRATLQWVKS